MKKIIKVFEGGSLKAQLLKGATGTAGLKLVNMLLTFIVGMLLARNLGPENYGIYTFVLSVITLLGLPTKAGLPTLIVRETAKYQLQEEWSYLRGLLTLANIFVVGFSIFVAVVAAGIAWSVWGGEQNIKTSTFLWALLLLPLVAFGNIRGATLRGLRKVVQGQFSEQVVRPLVLIILVGSVVALERELTPQITMQYNVVAALIAFIVGTALLFRGIPPTVRRSESSFELSAWFRSLVPLSLMSGMLIANGQIGILVLGFLSTANQVGVFKVGLSVVSFVIVFMQIIDKALAPHITQLSNSNKKSKLQGVLHIAAWTSLLTSLPIAGVLIVFGEELITVVFGADYTADGLMLSILCGGQIINAMTGSSSLMLSYAGYEKVLLQSVTLFIVANSILCFTLIPSFGALGAAISLAVSQSGFNIINAYRLFVLSGYNSTVLKKWR